MSLSVGTKVGPYEILAPIGAGGMGEVYRAHDSRLNRDVAIKTLPAAFAEDADRMARFQREAQVLAALNHPHIAGIYGIESSAIVMELVEGHTLAGPVPIDEAIAIARQIADALDAAHQKNIIHRDLKPANVKITPEGRVKVLDFGLAKAFDVSPVTVNSPTVTMESTREGVIMGTAGYMSPEQARGIPVDRRADIWSFGAVFYELLTGCRAFKGKTVSDTLASVLTADPDWSKLPAGTPLSVRRVLERCLQRDPNRRLRDIGDVWIEVDSPVDATRRSKLRWAPWELAVLAVLVAVWVTWEWLHVPVAPPRAVTRSTTTLAKDLHDLRLSRDGTRLAYSDWSEAAPHLSMRMMDQLDVKPIPGAVYGRFPEFSPDGQWIVYFTDEAPFQLRKIPVTGGTPIVLYDMPDDWKGGATWGLGDTIVFATSKGLMRVPAVGGAAQSLTVVNTKDGETKHHRPHFLPGGKTILFSIYTANSGRGAVLDLKTGAYRVVVNKGHDASYVPSGHLVFIRGPALFAVPFDLKRLEVTGPEKPVVEGIDAGNFTFSDSSLLVFRAIPEEDPPTTLEWTNRQGVAEALPEQPHYWKVFKVSPDGRFVAASILNPPGLGDRKSDIWIYDVERRSLTRLTFEGDNIGPVWAPDGRSVSFLSFREGRFEIYRAAADKSRQPELLLRTELEQFGGGGGAFISPDSWAPDGKTLLYTRVELGKHQIWTLAAPGSGGESKPRLFSRTTFNEMGPNISPDGKWVAYESDESGRDEVYVEPFPGPGGKSQISIQGGNGPVWSRTGRELFYVESGTDQLMSVDVPAGPVFRAGHPKALFKVKRGAGFDVTPDPNRFLVERVPEKPEGTTFVTITDWFDDLRRLVPTKN
jgi:dipeptidyl aminopeptidase/acylaminoacyl peptidase